MKKTLHNAHEAMNGALETEIAPGLLPPGPRTGPGRGLHPIKVEAHVSVALQLRCLRGASSQSEIAERLGISYQANQRLENPVKGNPSVKTLARVARALGKRLEIALV